MTKIKARWFWRKQLFYWRIAYKVVKLVDKWNLYWYKKAVEYDCYDERNQLIKARSDISELYTEAEREIEFCELALRILK